MEKEFTGDNLIGDIKKLSGKKLKSINNIKMLFDKHNISDNTQEKLLDNIEKKLKDYSTTKDLTSIIVNVIEKEWM